MPTRTGTPSQVDASGGSGSTTVTVPAGANTAVAFWSHYDDAGSTLSALTLNGVGFTIPSQLAVGGSTAGVGVGYLVNPATGSQTLAWTWSAGGARAEGGFIVVVYVQDGNTSDPVRDADTDADVDANNVTVTIDTNTTDLVLAMGQSFSGATPGLDGTVFIDNASLNSEIYDVSEVTPGVASVTINMTGENYSTMAAIALKAVAGGATRPDLMSLLGVS